MAQANKSRTGSGRNPRTGPARKPRGRGKKLLAALARVGSLLKWLLLLLTDERKLRPVSRKMLSLVLLAAAGAIAFVPFEKCFLWWCGPAPFIPSFISGLLALGLVFPLYARGILIWDISVYRLLSAALVLLVGAVAIEIAILGGSGDSGFSGFFGSLTGTLLAAALLLSWFGMREIAGHVWLLVLVPIIYNAVSNNQTLGFYGFIFIVCAFLGLMLQSANSFQNTLAALASEYSHHRGLPHMSDSKQRKAKTVRAVRTVRR